MISAVGAFACGKSTKTASVDKAATGVYSCDSKDKAEVKSADASAPAAVQTAAATSSDVSCPYLEALKKANYESTGAREASVKAASAGWDCSADKSKMAKCASTANSKDCPMASQCDMAGKAVKAADKPAEVMDEDQTASAQEKVNSEKL